MSYHANINMQIAHTASEMRGQLQALRGHKSIAFVPTMGCLHQGHLSLIEKAKSLADIVVVSIYVNPLQFAPSEDLEQYPRPFEADARLCADAGVDFLFHPASLYPESGSKVRLNVSTLNDCLCGASRPDHFDGVVTAVNVLFNIVQPNIAIFGEKDWQQLSIIRHMVSDLSMPIEIIGAAIVREPDGLAMSSRNRYLNNHERQQALAISQALIAMQQQAENGEHDVKALRSTARNILEKNAITAQYIEIRNATSLEVIDTLDHHNNQNSRAFIAAHVGAARLIDNMPIHSMPQEQQP